MEHFQWSTHDTCILQVNHFWEVSKSTRRKLNVTIARRTSSNSIWTDEVNNLFVSMKCSLQINVLLCEWCGSLSEYFEHFAYICNHIRRVREKANVPKLFTCRTLWPPFHLLWYEYAYFMQKYPNTSDPFSFAVQNGAIRRFRVKEDSLAKTSRKKKTRQSATTNSAQNEWARKT